MDFLKIVISKPYLTRNGLTSPFFTRHADQRVHNEELFFPLRVEEIAWLATWKSSSLWAFSMFEGDCG
jgi:hypothetical protein